MKMYLEEFGESHLTDRYLSWLNDPEVVRFSELRHHRHSLEECREYREGMTDSGNFFWAIELDETRFHVGNIAAYVDRNNGVADLTILIGERSVWGKGIAKNAMRKSIEILEASGIRKVSGGTMALNIAMIAVFRSLGFEEEGRRRSHFLVDGAEVDLVNFGKLLNRNIEK